MVKKLEADELYNMYSIDKRLNFVISIYDLKMLWKYRIELVLVRKINIQPHKNLRYIYT